MKIKYEINKTFKGDYVITPCPNGYEETKVHSQKCADCNFYKRKIYFKQEIICTYDKYHKPIPIIKESVTEVKYISKAEELSQAIEEITEELKKPGIIGN